MLKKRLIVSLRLNDGVLYRTKKFVPDYRYTQKYVGVGSVDEVVILDVTPEGRSKNFFDSARGIMDRCFVPVAMGGWITSLEEAQYAIREVGAEKVIIGTWAFEDGSIERLADKFGSQSVVVSIDVKDRMVWKDHGGTITNWCAIEWARRSEYRGAGEILLTDIDHDGSLRGFNLPLLESVTERVTVPVVICGGCGSWEHVKDAFDSGADGAATSNIYHYTEVSMNAAKEYLVEKGVPVRPCA